MDGATTGLQKPGRSNRNDDDEPLERGLLGDAAMPTLRRLAILSVAVALTAGCDQEPGVLDESLATSCSGLCAHSVDFVSHRISASVGYGNVTVSASAVRNGD